MEDINTLVQGCLSDARVAMGHGKYKEAKIILLQAYQAAPDNTDVLQKLGGACTLLGEFDEALAYFTHNMELDPENGNNHYMLGNIYFVKSQYQKAFSEYVEAEDKGCTGEANQKLHYQMALICSIKGDRKSALIHMQQYEDSDPTGKVALDETYLTEKLKLYMQEEDAENSVKYARILLEIKPTDFRYYGLLFTLLMAAKRYDEAGEVLDRAGKYIDLNYEQKLEILLQRVSMYVEMADDNPEEMQKYLEDAMDAIDLVQGTTENLKLDNIREMMLLQAELYLKGNSYATALEIAEELLKGPSQQKVPEVRDLSEHLEQLNNGSEAPGDVPQDEEFKKYAQLIENMSNKDPGIAEKLLNNDDAILSKLTKDNSVSEANDVDAVKKMVEEMVKDSDDAYHMFSPELFMDRLNNVLVSCYIESDRFEDALPYAKAMKESKRVNFANFGYYIESLAMQKLAQENKKDKAEAEKIYQYAVAYYRKKMMDDPSDITAAVFRARLYAENGKYELAEQVAGMLDDQAMQSLQEYIDECRETAAK